MTTQTGIRFGTKLKILAVVALLGGGSIWYVTQTSTSDERIVTLQVEVSDVAGKAASAYVSAHSLSSLNGRQEWTEASWSKTYKEDITVPAFESVEFFLTAAPLGSISQRRSVTCTILVSGKHAPRSPEVRVSYPGDPPNPCAASVLVPPLTK